MTGYGSALTSGYGPDDLRAWKQNSSGATYFLYSKMNQPVCEFNASGTLTATNTYGHAGLVSRRAGSTSTFYTFDPQGSVAQRLNASGGIVSSDTGDAFGSRATTGGGDVFGHVGQWGYYSDGETGLCLCQHRYYDPATGRFVTRDPSGYKGGVNLYNYCQNSGVNAVDPSGFGSWQEELYEGLASCAAIMFGDYYGRGGGDGCADAGNCAGALVASAMMVGCPEMDVMGAAVVGCLDSMIGSIAGALATQICDFLTNVCCYKPPTPCQVMAMCEQGLESCAEGALTGAVGVGAIAAVKQALDTELDVVISVLGGQADADCEASDG